MNLTKSFGASLILCAWMLPISLTAQQINKMETSKTTGYAPVNGLKMYYEIHGNGTTPLVLIHGGGSTIETSFGNILPLFAAHHKVIAVELQAHGRTNDRDSPESFEQDADDVAALLRYLKVDKANILGFSNGGTTTLQIAIRHPEVVNKIIVVAGAYQREGFITGFFEGMQHATLDNMPQQLKVAYEKVAPDKTQLIVMFKKDKQRMIDFKDIPDQSVQSIKAPALFMVADKDVITIEHTVRMSKLVPVAELAVLPGGHGSYIGEVGSIKAGSKLPEVTVALVGEFLEK
ncbi:alpha/beta hydrolase [Dyadobacter sp.]|uniref:alpha/beta fold hydrolase n=2 Tax=Dyadobacter sp. TaxID=1914288 RepID=UPI0032635419